MISRAAWRDVREAHHHPPVVYAKHARVITGQVRWDAKNVPSALDVMVDVIVVLPEGSRGAARRFRPSSDLVESVDGLGRTLPCGARLRANIVSGGVYYRRKIRKETMRNSAYLRLTDDPAAFVDAPGVTVSA